MQPFISKIVNGKAIGLTNMSQDLQDEIQEELSECCGAGTYGDYKICESCGEHCG